MTVSMSFTAAGVSGQLSLKPGQSLTLEVSGTYTGFVDVEASNSPTAFWNRVIAGAEDAEYSATLANETNGTLWYRFRARDTDSETAFGGTAVTELADANDTVAEIKNRAGDVVVRIKDDGIEGYGSGDGNVVGPASVTANHLAAFDGTTGKLLKSGGAAPAAAIPASYLDTDTALAADSDVKVPSQKAVKAYVAANGGGDVVGPAASTHYNLAAFDGETGKLLQDSGYTTDSFLAADALNPGLFSGDPLSLVVEAPLHIESETGLGVYIDGSTIVLNESDELRATGVFDGDIEAAGSITAGVILECGVVAAGGAAETTAAAVEAGNAVVHRTTLTLASMPLSVASIADADGYGADRIYTFPAGRILVLGAMADLTLVIEAAEQGDFTDATPEGTAGIIASGDAINGPEMATKTAYTMSAYAGSAKAPSESSAQFNGTATPLDAYVTVKVNAADIDDDAIAEILISGIVTLTWINLGDF